MTTSSHLVVRADATPQIGAGHVMRTLALAQAWQDAGGSACYAMSAPLPGIVARLDAEAVAIDEIHAEPGSDDDARETIELAKNRDASWVVVDGYQFGGNYQRIIKESGLWLLVLDDYGHADHYWADLVLNQNLHAEERLYRDRESYTRLLLGVRFALLRREFLKWQGWQREVSGVACKVLITLGGGDPDNVTLRMMEALGQVDVPGIEAVVLAGATNPHYAELQAAAGCSPVEIRLESVATDMPSLMMWADVAPGAAGSTSWERAFMGLPSLVVTLAANQEPLARDLAAAGVVDNLGGHDRLEVGELACRLSSLMQSSPERRRMADAGRQMVDGDGSRRVLMDLRNDRLRLRTARPADCELLWHWINQPKARAGSFHSEPIPWESHVAWFDRMLCNAGCHIFIGFDRDDLPIGNVRFEACQSDVAEVGISVCSTFHGQGYGTILLRLALAELFQTTAISVVHAFIKPENQASIRVFEKAAFRPDGTTVIADVPALKYVCYRSDFHAR